MDFPTVKSKVYQTVLALSVFLFSFAGRVEGLTVKSREQDAAIQWTLAIREFVKTRQRLPETWSDLREVENARYFLNIVNQRDRGFETDHRFLNSSVSINLSGKNYRLLAMGARTAIPNPKYSNHADVRMTVLASDDGDIQPASLSETTLAAALLESGSNLKNYTGLSGDWKPEPVLNEQAVSAPAPEKNTIHNESDGGSRDDFPLRIGKSSWKTEDFLIAALVWMGGTLALVLGAIFIWKRKRSEER